MTYVFYGVLTIGAILSFFSYFLFCKLVFVCTCFQMGAV